MTSWYRTRFWRRTLAVATVAILSVGWLSAGPAAAADASTPAKLEQLDTSLKWIPEDAAFYSSMLRKREQIEAIAGSRVWAKLESLPVVKMGWQIFQAQAASSGSVPAKIQAALEDPQVKDLLALLGDMFSNEVFVYGDADVADLVDLLQRINAAMRFGPALLQLTGEAADLDKDEIQAAMLLGVLADNLELVKTPGIVVGFKLTDTQRATLHLGKLELVAGALLYQAPTLKGSLKRTELGGHQYLTLTLDGEMIPWEEVPMEKLRKLESEDGQIDKLIAKLKKQTLVIALGVRDDYLLLSIGPSTDTLARLGKGPGLAGRPELKPLAEFTDKRLASISYVSRKMNEKIATGKKDIDDLLEAVEQVLPTLGLDKEGEAQIRKDAAELAEDLKRMVPEAGPVMVFSFITDRGMESYSYAWGRQPQLDGSKPLGLLEHVGGHPILAVVSRSKVSVDDYDLLIKWAKKAYGYFDRFCLPEMGSSDRKRLEKLAKLLKPLLERLDTANRQMLLPAFKDGQTALVIDAKLKSKQFVAALPATERPMPMIEPALVLGVSDSTLLRQGLAEYWEIIKAVIDAVAIVAPDMPEIDILEPEVVHTDHGELYVFRLPEELGVDEQITPSVGLSEKVVAFSISQEHTKRLLKATPLAVGGLLQKADRPMAMAVCFDWAGLVTAATPWIDFATEQIVAEQFGGGDPDKTKAQLKAIKDQVHTVLDVLKVLRNVTSETYVKDDAVVTHTLTEIRDID